MPVRCETHRPRLVLVNLPTDGTVVVMLRGDDVRQDLREFHSASLRHKEAVPGAPGECRLSPAGTASIASQRPGSYRQTACLSRYTTDALFPPLVPDLVRETV